MKLKAENFGPIHHADIELKPLTVIIGKNNAGKSMLAQLIFTLMKLRERRVPIRFLRHRYIPTEDIIVVLHRRFSPSFQVDVLLEKIKETKELTPISLVKMILDMIIESLTHSLNETLSILLERNFGIELKSLVNLYSSYTKIECAYSKYSIVEFTITKDGKLDAKFNVKMMEKLIDNILRDNKINRLIGKIPIFKEERDFVVIITVLIEEITKFIFPERSLLSTLYIPAGRAGLLEGYEAVSSALITLAPTAPLKGITMPPMPAMA